MFNVWKDSHVDVCAIRIRTLLTRKTTLVSCR